MPLLINGQVVEDGEFREEADRLRPRLAESMPDSDPLEIGMRASEWARENVIERVLLQQEALRDPEPVPPELSENAIQRLTSQPGGQIGLHSAGEGPRVPPGCGNTTPGGPAICEADSQC